MLVLRIVATVFMAIGCMTAITKNSIIWEDSMEQMMASIYGLAWRGFVIAAIWLI